MLGKLGGGGRLRQRDFYFTKLYQIQSQMQIQIQIQSLGIVFLLVVFKLPSVAALIAVA